MQARPRYRPPRRRETGAGSGTSGGAMASILVAAALLGPAPTGIPPGSAKLEVEVAGRRLNVFTYKPEGYRGGPLVVVFHGLARNADEYRDFARGLADRTGCLVASPEFDEDRFPYQK